MKITDEEIVIVTGGSFFKAGAILIDPLRAAVLAEIKEAHFIHFDAQPVIGAVLLAMRSDRQLPEQIAATRECLIIIINA